MQIRHCATAAVLALALTSAQADTVTHTSNALPLTDTDWSSFLDLQQFDLALGNLQSVSITLSSSLVGSLAAENRNPSPTTITVGLASTVRLLFPDAGSGSSLQVAHAASRSFNAAAWDGTKDYAGTSGFRDGEILGDASISSTYDSSAMLQLFTGTGVVTTRVDAVGESQRLGTGAFFTSFGNRTSAQASVTYTYIHTNTAAPVPEPTTLALMLAGLATVCVLGSRRQNR
jgi:hypothetical protein